jgi:ribonucleoside-diphosphate reductase alpha chain
LIRIGDLIARAAAGETTEIYTNDVTSEDHPASRVVATRPVRYMVTGTNEIVELRFSDGSRLRCTPGHRVWTSNRGWVHAEDLLESDEVVRSFEYAARTMARAELPEPALRFGRLARGLGMPEKWDEDLGHFLGWLVGDGCVTDRVVTTVYGDAADQTDVLPRHAALLRRWTGFDAKPSHQPNGTVQLRSGKAGVRRFMHALGVSNGRSSMKVVPESIFEAPEEAVLAFLQGLFDADGCVVDDEMKGTRYVGLGSRSEELLLGVQELLASFGIASRIYQTGTKTESFSYVRKSGEAVSTGQTARPTTYASRGARCASSRP